MWHFYSSYKKVFVSESVCHLEREFTIFLGREFTIFYNCNTAVSSTLSQTKAFYVQRVYSFTDCTTHNKMLSLESWYASNRQIFFSYEVCHPHLFSYLTSSAWTLFCSYQHRQLYSISDI